MSSVDVIVPCYNYGRFLRYCVSSVLGQHDVAVRVLILDDCSTDDTPEVGEALAASDARVVYRRHPSNRGHIATYNEGLDWAESEYLLLLSADDALTGGALSRATRIMDRHPNVVFTCGKAIATPHPEEERQPTPSGEDGEIESGLDFIDRCCRTASNPVRTPTAVVRTRVQKQVGGYRATLPHTGDLEMWLRLAVHGDVSSVNAFQAFYRVHGQNMFRQYLGEKELDQLQAAFESVFADLHGHSRIAKFRRGFARAHARETFWVANGLANDLKHASARTTLARAFRLDPTIICTPRFWRLCTKLAVGPKGSLGLRKFYARVCDARKAVGVVPTSEAVTS